MGWTILIGFVVALVVAVSVVAARRLELRRMEQRVGELRRARERGSNRARLQYPHVDLSKCLGCGTCIRACPEEGVLELIHGQAIVVHGARCIGHGRCAAECPTGAIVVALGDVEERTDIPAIDHRLEAPGRPGLFLAGELTGYALIRTAIAHGTAVADEVAARRDAQPHRRDGVDLCIVGAGPAGLACALQARAHGLSTLVLEQQTLGGTVASYPRRKLVMTQPVDLPLYGKLDRSTWEKEELMELWTTIAEEHELPVRCGVRFEGLESRNGSGYDVLTDKGPVRARNVCLALGRRGTPRKLGVPGEDLPKVAYSLLDAQSYRGRRILVVGGGDSAIEAALGLAQQPGNEVAVSYRKHAFFRLKARNETQIEAAIRAGRIAVYYESSVACIGEQAVDLTVGSGDEARTVTLRNDDVFVMAGGSPPFPLLEQCGVSFSPEDRPVPPTMTDERSGLLVSLLCALVAGFVAVPIVLARSDYYALPLEARPDSPWHDALRPSGTVGLFFGVVAAILLLVNLTFLLRRNPRIPLRFGSLKAWMTSHVTTGLLVLLFAVLHSAMAPGQTVGGHALLGMTVLAVTGAIGRYFYSFVPRAANGRELDFEEVRSELASLSGEWERENRAFVERVREDVESFQRDGGWSAGLLKRVRMLLVSRLRARRNLRQLRSDAREQGLSADQVGRLLRLAERGHRSALFAAHYEDLRGLLASWRYLHRWIALLVVLLVAVHVFVAFRYGGVFR